METTALDWVDWLNRRRLLKPIGYIPPAEAEARFCAQINDLAHGRLTNTQTQAKPAWFNTLITSTAGLF